MKPSPAPPSAPTLSPARMQQVKAEIHRQIVSVIDLSGLTGWSSDRLRQEVQALAVKLSRGLPEKLRDAERDSLVGEVMAEVFGLGPLEQLMKDPTISDILVNGPQLVYVERLGRLEPTGVTFKDNSHLTQVIQRIASQVGRRIDESMPMVDARLPDGSRVNAILPPLSLDGPMLSIRRFGVRLGEGQLLANGTLTSEMICLLEAAVSSRINILISGGTGSGKTTLLNVLSAYIPTDERLVSIEDAAELSLRQPHVVRLETRLPNLEGTGAVSQRDLVRNSLRMRPDRIIVGEVRGPEALDMLQAMNTGHEGSLTTVHANDTRDALSRLEMMVTMAGFEVPLPVIRKYVSSALTLLVHVNRMKGGARKVSRITELVGLKGGKRYVVRDLFEFRQTGIEDGQAVGTFHATGHVPTFLERLYSYGIDLPSELFTQRQLTTPLPVGSSGSMGNPEEAGVAHPSPGSNN